MTTARRVWASLRRRLRQRRVCITQAEGSLRPATARGSAVVVCGPGFDQRVPNAMTMSRMGWCRGFEAAGIPYRLVAAPRLVQELDTLDDPMVWMSSHDHAGLGPDALASLRRHRHAVLVDAAFQGSAQWLAARDLPPALAMDLPAVARVLSTRPRFLFTLAAPSGLEFCAHWLRSAVPLVSLPMACDTTLYVQDAQHRPPLHGAPVAAHDMVFVGGFWDYKARQFAHYLEPHAERLSVYGWAHWPYGRYGGQLPLEHEAPLYRAARLCPVINEPHVPLMGIDINERVFKVLGAGGLALTDATPAYRDWFTNDELLVPKSLQEYRELVQALLAGEIDGGPWRQRGRAAVLARHTYKHRAAQFRACMDGDAGSIAASLHAGMGGVG